MVSLGPPLPRPITSLGAHAASVAAAIEASAAPTATISSVNRPPASRHYSTWVSQNRQMERQRSFYSNYYSK